MVQTVSGVRNNLWQRQGSGLYAPNRRNFPIDRLALYLPLWHPELAGSPIISKDLNAHSCTVTGATWQSEGMLFDGTDDYITIPLNTCFNGGSELSVEVWYKTSSVISAKALVCLDPSLYKWMIYITDSSDDILFYFRTASGIISAGYAGGVGVINDGNWHHVVCVWKRPYGKFYFDGELKGTSVARDEDMTVGDESLVIAQYRTVEIPATIGEVRVYRSKALILEEIAHNYRNPARPEWRN